MIAVIVVLMIPDVLVLFLLTSFYLIFREEFKLRIDFAPELIDEFLHLILIPVQPFQRDLPAALHLIHLYLQLDSRYGVICLVRCLIGEGVAAHEHLFK